MDGLDDDIVKEFLVESYESLDQLDSDLLALEDEPDNRDRLASIFRTIHTIKGTSGFLALPKLEKVAHVGENLLVPLRDGAFQLNNHIADGLLGMVDAIRTILSNLEECGIEGDADYAALIEQLQQLLQTQGDIGGGGPDSIDQLDQGTAPSESADEPAPVAQPSGEATTPSHSEAATEPVATQTSPPVADNNGLPATEPTASPPPAASPSKVTANKPAASSQAKSSDGEKAKSVADSTVRIDVDLLDKLMNLVGELVLARNQILRICEKSKDSNILAASQRLNLITTELQEGVMKTRMQPIRHAWSKLPRVVRDLATACKKKVAVQMEGADTELDKTILEAIKDPLTHIVRNSVDHGIESPDVRVENGKAAEGILLLRAFHEGGQVIIEICDDGGGIRADRVRDKAIEKGLITAEQAELMGERELINLILLPGFSTAQTVTNVSGRGVGMDVVKTNIERIGGTLEIKSAAGEGTTLRIKIPLTLAIVPALITETAGEAYAIPQVSLLELVRLDCDLDKCEIEFIHDVPVYRLRGNLLPLVFLDELLGLRPPRGRNDYNESVNIIVLQAEDRQFGLVVDSVIDSQEIVVKPLGGHLENIACYAGATIMGDGMVALILDVLGVAQRSNILSEHRDRVPRNSESDGLEGTSESELMLLVESQEGNRSAIKLSTVARLEKFQASQIEHSGNDQVIQYRGEIMPLVQLGSGYGGVAGDESGLINAVVYSAGPKHIGIVVQNIVDVVNVPTAMVSDPNQGQCIIRDRVTEVIDLDQVVSHVAPQGFSSAAFA
ncbi:chemotaxis protein CheA [Roseiconus lacunae]|uniref:chemotaxis protein CheA n=1 Tax=Roseiconus lacunae TaxID=2605694 RepID=UPI0030859C8D|nr:chemotaxis protein CheA [Stieleria sp. HD01]